MRAALKVMQADTSAPTEVISPEQTAVNLLRYSTSTHNGYVVLNKTGFKKFKDNVNHFTTISQNTWEIGDSYKYWAKGFLTHHNDFFVEYDEILNQTLMASKAKNVLDLELQTNLLNTTYSKLLSALESEKPKWRFKYFIIPVAVGRPFHSEAREFAESLSNELESRLEQTKEFISNRIDSIESSARSRDSIQYQLAHEARRVEGGNALLARAEQDLPGHSEDESKEELINPLVNNIRPLDIWIKNAKAIYTYWGLNRYSTTLKFVNNKNVALTHLDEVLSHLNAASDEEKFLFLFIVNDMYGELSTLCLNDPMLHAPEHKSNLDQIILLRKFLQVIIHSQTEDFSQRKGEFEDCCNTIFNSVNDRVISSVGYSNHGLLRINSSSEAVPEVQHPCVLGG
jgi:hypothetical protein